MKEIDKVVKSELQKCIFSPYYFATHYLVIGTKDGKPIMFTTWLTEEEYNKQFENLQDGKKKQSSRRRSI